MEINFTQSPELFIVDDLADRARGFGFSFCRISGGPNPIKMSEILDAINDGAMDCRCVVTFER